jgi:hypothetical protein
MTQTQEIAAPDTPMPFVHPDLYDLAGGGITVTYHPVGVGGVPTLTYQDHHRSASFRGDQIRSVEVPDLGTVISVTLVMTVDAGSTTFSVVLPDVNLPNQIGSSASISAPGITTIHRFSIVPGLNQGQREVYTVTHLSGTAWNVIIPL